MLVTIGLLVGLLAGLALRVPRPSPDPDSPGVPVLQDIQLREFDKLRDEIGYRTNAQLALLILNVTAVGTIAGFFLAAPGTKPPDLLLLVPLVSSSLGLLWLDHGMAIADLGAYIRDYLPTGGWEKSIHRTRRNPRRRALFALPLLLIFVGPSVASLTTYYFAVTGSWTRLAEMLYASGLSLSSLFAFILVDWLWKRRQLPRAASSANSAARSSASSAREKGR